MTPTLADVAVLPEETVDAHDAVLAAEPLLRRDGYAVVTRAGAYAGLLTLSDVLERPHRLVADCLSHKPMLSGGTSIQRALDLMDRRSLHVLPVGRKGQLTGVASYKTIVALLSGLGQEGRWATAAMEDLRFVTGGVAHDLNNLLHGIAAQIELTRLEGPAQAAAPLDTIEDALARAQRLAGQLLQLSRGECPVDPQVALSDFIRDTARFYATGRGVSLELNLASDLAPVDLPTDLLARVVANLVVNALQACETTGSTVTVSAANATAGRGRSHAGRHERHVRLVVSDDGAGIEPQLLQRIFEPNFTTRSGGSGLGLAIVRSIVNTAGGQVEVESGGGRTSFAVQLPARRRRGSASEA